MPKIDLSKLPLKEGSIYPENFARKMEGRSSIRVGEAGGLTQFGANITILEPGAMSSLRHWHLNDDEFVIIIEGECVLADDFGESVMKQGDCAAFPSGDQNGHHFINRSTNVSKFLVIGTHHRNECVEYSDVDMKGVKVKGNFLFTRKDGSAI